jgi:hypothetical protein
MFSERQAAWPDQVIIATINAAHTDANNTFLIAMMALYLPELSFLDF